MKLWIGISLILVGAVFFVAMIWSCLVIAAREDERNGWK